MAAQTKTMHQIRQILERYNQQTGLRKIERLTGFSRTTIWDYVRRVLATGQPIGELLALDDTLLVAVISGGSVATPSLDLRWKTLEPLLPTKIITSSFVSIISA
jgi:hypothetical protein